MLTRMRTSAALVLVSGVIAGCGIEVNIDGSGGNSDPETGSYSGTTSQGLPIAFELTEAGAVEGVRFGWRARCEDGRVHVNSILLDGAPVEDESFAVDGSLDTGGVAHVTGEFDGSEASGELSRSRGTAFGVNCRATGITWSAEPGPAPEMPPPSTEGGEGKGAAAPS